MFGGGLGGGEGVSWIGTIAEEEGEQCGLLVRVVSLP